MQGRRTRRARVDRARAGRRGAADSRHGERFAVDPQVTLLGLLAIPLFHLGLVEQAARACSARTRARGSCDSRWRGWPRSGTTRCWRCGSATRSGRRAGRRNDGAGRRVRARAGPEGSRWFRGWADARKGLPRRAIADPRGLRRTMRGSECWSGGSEVLGYAAEALVLAGDWEARTGSSRRHCRSRTRRTSASTCRSCS